MLDALYKPSLGLLTDLYQLTMAAGYHHAGVARRRATFNLTFRRPPYGSAFAVAAGLGPAVEFLQRWGFSTADLDYLSGLLGNDGEPLFADDFLEMLAGSRFTCDIDAIPEGTVVAAHAPLVRVTGPLYQAQIVETALLTILNFQTLIATKAARVCHAAGPDGTVLEFGLRRAQGIDGALSASRAAFVGGVHGTSNVLAGRLLDMPVKGTHAHAWVMVFEDEVASFVRYAAAMPHNCVFLVDTYDTIEGVRRAISVGHDLRDRGHELVGIRLDSGDLCALAKAARELLDDAGFPDAVIVASNDLDEHRITELRSAGAPISVWGVGTRLATGHPKAALGGVYKLAAIEDDQGVVQPRIKLSEMAIKVSNPGIQQVRRRVDAETGRFAEDVLYDVHAPGDVLATRHPDDHDLLVPVLRGGQLVDPLPPLQVARARTLAQLARLPENCLSITAPEPYPLRLEPGLAARKANLIARHRSRGGAA